MANYDVLPGPRRTWHVKRENASRATVILATQIEAQKAATGYVKRSRYERTGRSLAGHEALYYAVREEPAARCVGRSNA